VKDEPRDWFEWHRPYDDPASDLAGRLLTVQRHVVRALDEAGTGPVRSSASVPARAATCSAWQPDTPELVLVCGVFGHATPDDIRNTIRCLPMLCAAGATVVWTRGRAEPDMRPAIRTWFGEEGFPELAFESGGDHSWGVGANRLMAPPKPFERGMRLFTLFD